jgi:hypothetical protein
MEREQESMEYLNVWDCNTRNRIKGDCSRRVTWTGRNSEKRTRTENGQECRESLGKGQKL